MHVLERRIRQLELAREQRTRSHIIHLEGAGAKQHHGSFIVRIGDKKHRLVRDINESWQSFMTRADALVTGIMKVVLVVPINEHGEFAYHHEDYEHDYSN